jgi:hypothetical protein
MGNDGTWGFRKTSAGSGDKTASYEVYFDGNNMGIGTTSPGQALDVAGTIRQSTAKSCSLGVVTNASGDFSACVSSDERLKTNIAGITYNSTTIDALAPVLYKWKDPKARDDQQHAGFIAEQVAQVFPQAVTPAGFVQMPSSYTYTTTGLNGKKRIVKGPVYDGAALYGVDPNAMIALLVKEVQDLRKKDQDLSKRIAALEAARTK